MKEVELTLVAISSSESQKNNFVIIFEEVDGLRRLPVIVGSFEAQAIAIALERMSPSRPLTHDVFHHTILKLGAELSKIVINKVEDNVFFAYFVLNINGKILHIDSRTSDAVALAVRFGAQIFTTEEVMKKVSIVLNEPSSVFTNKRGELEDYSLEELNKILEQLVEKEDYRGAVRVRNAIKKKEGK